MNFYLWDIMPWAYLPHSAKVDFALLIAGIKPNLRVILDHPAKVYSPLKNLLKSHIVHNHNDVLYIADNLEVVRKLVKIDNDHMPHEIEFGCLLGYPKCCSEKIKVIGESDIDTYNDDFNQKVERFSLLDISLYNHGIGLISHVPCSIDCEPSLRQAHQFYQSLRITVGSEKFCVWRNEIINYFSQNEYNHPYKIEKVFRR